MKRIVVVVMLWMACGAAFAAGLPPEAVKQLASDDNDARIAAIATIASQGDAFSLQFLQALDDGRVKTSPDAKVFVDTGSGFIDAASGEPVGALPAGADDISVNNRMRKALEEALSSLKLLSKDVDERFKAAQALAGGAEESALPLIKKALATEPDGKIRAMLVLAQASVELKSADPATRLNAVKALGESGNSTVKTMLLSILEKTGETWSEPDVRVRDMAQASLKSVESRLARGAVIAGFFTGISLGSVLLLAALGLAITYGLMGVINMAHGELVMIGAYSTYVVQNLFKAHAAQFFAFYPIAAIPVAFIVSGLVGVLMERLVIRFLYGRPLETLLATWGISLFLIQLVRTVFGAQNVAVENPGWLSGGFEVTSELVLPYSRIAIIAFAVLVLLVVWLILTRTRLGLFVRAVTQNRAMADCTGVPTSVVDMAAFGIGSGIAGLGGVALSQLGNVGPDLGQSYIVDSFMVVVLGGVGQLAGTVYASFGLGLINKFLEGQVGAVLAKIAILVFIILFIQKRPQGLFALKGRFVES